MKNKIIFYLSLVFYILAYTAIILVGIKNPNKNSATLLIEYWHLYLTIVLVSLIIFGQYRELKKLEKKRKHKSLLYKIPGEQILTVIIKDNDDTIDFDFFSDCGKFGTEEALAGFKLTSARLLEILSDRDDYSDEELN